MKKQTPDIIEQTMDFWSKRTGQAFSLEDARQMVCNVSGFFQVLVEWDRKELSVDVQMYQYPSGKNSHPFIGETQNE